ncbi:MAG: restriction endonuclease [Planctomycetes bacterium]|nr:restriction endonuclease [Planctomycetota bacterium]
MTEEHARVFVVRAGANGEDEDYALEHGLAIIGFKEWGALDRASDYESMVKIVSSERPDLKPRSAANYAGQLWTFALGMKEGDIVVLPRKLTSQVALGRVAGPYKHQQIGGIYRHTRPVNWIRLDVPRSTFRQDLLYSVGAFLTVCNITRNDAEHRVALVLDGKPDPGLTVLVEKLKKQGPTPVTDEGVGEIMNLSQSAHDQIVAHIQSRFAGHELARLVDAVLQVDGWVTRISPPGADGGVDILAGRGPLGLDEPRLCVQVKSQNSPVDVTVLRTLQGSLQTFAAKQGLLVCWGGYNKAVQQEARQSHFSVRLWESRDLVEAIYRTYDQLPAEIQAELPLKRIWMLVPEGSEE